MNPDLRRVHGQHPEAPPAHRTASGGLRNRYVIPDPSNPDLAPSWIPSRIRDLRTSSIPSTEVLLRRIVHHPRVPRRPDREPTSRRELAQSRRDPPGVRKGGERLADRAAARDVRIQWGGGSKRSPEGRGRALVAAPRPSTTPGTTACRGELSFETPAGDSPPRHRRPPETAPRSPRGSDGTRHCANGAVIHVDLPCNLVCRR